ncbi:hypothetical protein A3Q56_06417 [Intoshia linei]|uniref:Uncharacterized protein n=1 Tax=Intoshia linei TaxID=1819745 RepID=A0A177AWS3_9BILA|nr:hypothetical protein A3Q56_06417 [Intoshia linei]
MINYKTNTIFNIINVYNLKMYSSTICYLILSMMMENEQKNFEEWRHFFSPAEAALKKECSEHWSNVSILNSADNYHNHETVLVKIITYGKIVDNYNKKLSFCFKDKRDCDGYPCFVGFVQYNNSTKKAAISVIIPDVNIVLCEISTSNIFDNVLSSINLHTYYARHLNDYKLNSLQNNRIKYVSYLDITEEALQLDILRQHFYLYIMKAFILSDETHSKQEHVIIHLTSVNLCNEHI